APVRTRIDDRYASAGVEVFLPVVIAIANVDARGNGSRGAWHRQLAEAGAAEVMVVEGRVVHPHLDVVGAGAPRSRDVDDKVAAATCSVAIHRRCVRLARRMNNMRPRKKVVMYLLPYERRGRHIDARRTAAWVVAVGTRWRQSPKPKHEHDRSKKN